MPGARSRIASSDFGFTNVAVLCHCRVQEAFLDLMLPVLSRSLRAFESASAAPAAGRRMATALKRRRRAAAKAAGAHETDAVFKARACMPSHCRPCPLSCNLKLSINAVCDSLQQVQRAAMPVLRHVPQFSAVSRYWLSSSYAGLRLVCCFRSQGFVTRDRRRPHVRQADEEVAAAMEGGVTESEVRLGPCSAE